MYRERCNQWVANKGKELQKRVGEVIWTNCLKAASTHRWSEGGDKCKAVGSNQELRADHASEVRRMIETQSLLIVKIVRQYLQAIDRE